MDLVTNVYAVSKNFPSDELYGLTSQFDAQLFQLLVILQKDTEEIRQEITNDFYKLL